MTNRMLSKIVQKVRRVAQDRRRLSDVQRRNLERHDRELPLRSHHPEFKPHTLSLVSTGRCNLKCDMCPTHSKVIPDDYPWVQNPTSDISLETFKKFAARFPEATTVSIIGQGEPILNKEFFEIIAHADSVGMKVKSFSNGTTLKTFIDRILKSPLDTITISINGHDAEEYTRMTGEHPRHFETIKSNIKALTAERDRRAAPLTIHGHFIVDRINYMHTPKMAALGRELGVDAIYFVNFLPTPYDGFRLPERTITTDDHDIIRFLDEQFPPSVRRFAVLPTLLDVHSEKKNCHCHWSQARINGNGEVSSCSMMLLNMKDHPTIDEPDLWNGEWFQSMRKKFTSPSKADLESPCNNCTDNFGVDPWDDVEGFLKHRTAGRAGQEQVMN